MKRAPKKPVAKGADKKKSSDVSFQRELHKALRATAGKIPGIRKVF